MKDDHRIRISMKMLESIVSVSEKESRSAAATTKDGLIEIIGCNNCLPYICTIHLRPPEDIDKVYYAALDSQDKRLFYKSEYPYRTILSFTRYDLQTDDEEIKLAFWPVKNEVIGTPTYVGPISLRPPIRLGTYDLEVPFDKVEDHSLFHLVLPLIEKHYGKAALPGSITIEESTHDIYLPSKNTISLSSDRRNVIHELIHASRKQLLFASKKYKYDQTTEMIEEFFAEGVSNMIKDELNKLPNNHLKEGAVYGSTMGYNYDFRINDPSLITQDLQSTTGGILTLETARYYLASEAYHKIAIEFYLKTGLYFGKEFNKMYYHIIQEDPKDPDLEMFLAISEQLLPTVEATPTRKWLGDQHLFNCEFVTGEKIFFDLQDYYTHEEWIGIVKINLYETFENGSDWVCGKKRYKHNGKPIHVEVVHLESQEIIYSASHTIPDYTNGFGSVKLYFYYMKDSPAVAHFYDYDKKNSIESTRVHMRSGLHLIKVTAENVERSYLRFMGEEMFASRGKILIADSCIKAGLTSVQLIHVNKQKKKTSIAALAQQNKYITIDAPFIQNKNCQPGILTIDVNDGSTSNSFQRNIGYGGEYGGHQFWLGDDISKFDTDLILPT